MYAGHVGIALGARGFRKDVPLWALIIASQLPDWADAGLCVANLRSGTPGLYSHSFSAIAVLAAVAAAIYMLAARSAAGAYVMAAMVVSHAAGDWITGLKPTWTGGPMIGLQLYHYPMLDFVLEAAVIVIGWMFYRKSLPPERRSSAPSLALPGALLAFQLGADIFFSIAPGLPKC
jgi:hypothetical protein